MIKHQTVLKRNCYIGIFQYSAINRIRGQNKRADRNNVHKEIIKTIDFEKISKKFLDDRINMLIQNDKIINRLNRNKDSFCIADNDLNSSITDALPMTQSYSSFISAPSFSEDRLRRKNHLVKVRNVEVRMWKICGITSCH